MSLPTGIRSYNYAQDMAVFRTRAHWVWLGVLLALLFTGPLYWGGELLSVANLIGITIIAATGLNILTGYCGQLSIGHAGFIAVGAYAAAIITKRFELPFLVGLIGAGGVAGLVGVVFGIPSLRVKGFYLAISTIAAQFIIIWVINHWTGITGGFNGMSVPPVQIGRLTLVTQASQFYLIMIIVITVVFLAKNLSRTRAGRAFVAIRDNDLAAQVMGISLFRYKLLAFFIGCFLAGIAGSLFAHWTGFLNAENFTMMDSILYVGIIIIGGLGTTIGPIFGVLVIRWLQWFIMKISPVIEALFPNLPAGFTAGIGPMVFGIAIILFLIFMPRGLAHRWSLLRASYRLWPF
ncbi:MAG: branched-chain amino acid ABC transporter permease [Dehalococcoidales bacterium]|nr:MAG: branched-chain amino acid ABC transporter permease [Dehalococcoidales bacterium]